MDYQEAIDYFEGRMKLKEKEVQSENPDIKRADDKLMDIYKTSISAMQELQSLHDQGFSMERLKNIDFRKEVVEHINYDAYMELQDELEEYREIGTIEEIRECIQDLQIYKENDKRNLSRTDRLMDECTYRHDNGNCLKVGGFCTSVPLSHCQRYKDWYTDYRAYKQLGTLEEIREAVEKQKAKKPIIQPWSPARCPTCGEELSENLGDGYYRHRTFLERCTNVDCAQRLDWSEEE